MAGSFDPHNDTRAGQLPGAEDAPPPLRSARAAGERPVGPQPSSDEGRAESEMPLDRARIAEIRERYARGAYDAPDILDEVARRLLASGDV
ncbi:MAG TPA: hypothetical protein VFK04_14585 [Gemmatimonadaceae bacterium]|nr:hypothetical protein [Gemmatimonadaceae bacterium]